MHFSEFLDETASSSVGNKIGNLLTGKHNVNSKISYERFTKMSALYEAKQAELSDTIKPRKDHPAYAGKSREQCSRRQIPQDHPRVCGEKRVQTVFRGVTLGSPPRMRGKEISSIFFGKVPRITPAYAGKREGLKNDNTDNEDHPRVCGEKQ